MTRRIIISLLTATLVLSGCATNDPNRNARTGAAIGAVLGAVTGHQISHGSGRFVGAAAGAMAGASIGDYMDRQQQHFNRALAGERRRNELQIERLQDDTLRLNLDSEVSFDLNRYQIKPAFEPSLAKLAQVLTQYNRTVVHIVGHTDSSGTDEYNQQLSEKRALSVRDYLWSHGVSGERMRTEGRGESEPREANTSEAGRQLNRRVEIYIKPIVEGNEREAYDSPRY